MRNAALVLATLFFFMICGFNDTVYAENNNIPLKCVAAALIDQDSQRILYSKCGDKVLPMASTTKILTAIVAIENGKLNKKVSVSQRASQIGGSTVNLKKGEVISIEELIYGLMLRSGNDAAIAVAEAVGGSVEGFVEKMNEKAMELGLFHSSFTSPHGLDSDNHHTTAEELAKITAYAMNNSFFAKVTATKSIDSGRYGKFNRSYANINKFLFRREDADGVKTGYTGNAGKCLVASVKTSNARYIAVVFNSSDRWRDADKLVDFGQRKYRHINVKIDQVNQRKIKLYNGTSYDFKANISQPISIPVRKDGMEKITTKLIVPSLLMMPMNTNGMIGNVAVYVNNKIISWYPVYYGNKREE